MQKLRELIASISDSAGDESGRMIARYAAVRYVRASRLVVTTLLAPRSMAVPASSLMILTPTRIDAVDPRVAHFSDKRFVRRCRSVTARSTKSPSMAARHAWSDERPTGLCLV